MARDLDRIDARIEASLESLAIAVDAGARRRLAALSLLVAQWNERMNLTGHREPERIADRLAVPAVCLAEALPDFGSLADLGSGAGFPGLPIAILRPEARITLVESRERRHHFQRAAIREIEIANATPLRGRIEEIEAIPHEVALAQAVGPPSEVLAMIRGWVRPGGLLGIPASGHATPPTSAAGTSAIEVRRYRTPDPDAPGRFEERAVWLSRAT